MKHFGAVRNPNRFHKMTTLSCVPHWIVNPISIIRFRRNATVSSGGIAQVGDVYPNDCQNPNSPFALQPAKFTSLQYCSMYSPITFSNWRYSFASANDCLLCVGSMTMYGMSTTPTTPEQLLKRQPKMFIKGIFICTYVPLGWTKFLFK